MLANACTERDELKPGQYRDVISIKPIAFVNNAGYLERIVPTWAAGDALRPHVVDKAAFITKVDPTGGRRIYPVRNNLDAWIELGAPECKPGLDYVTLASAGGLSASASRVAQELAWAGTNAKMSIIHAGHYIKQEIELLRGWRPGPMRVPITLNGITLKDDALLIKDEPVMHFRPMYVYDRADAENTVAIRHEIVTIGKMQYITFDVPDVSRMAEPVIDPTLVLQPDAAAGLDTYTLAENADTNYGTSTDIRCRIPGAFCSLALIKFDLSSIPAGAVLSVGAHIITTTIGFYSSGTTSCARILVANSAWTELGATWNYAIATTTRWAGDAGANGGADAGCSVSGTDYSATPLGNFTWTSTYPVGTPLTASLNLTELAAMITTNSGLIHYTTINNNQWFASSDHATAAYRPKLTVDYSLPGGGGVFQSSVFSSAMFGKTMVR